MPDPKDPTESAKEAAEDAGKPGKVTVEVMKKIGEVPDKLQHAPKAAAKELKKVPGKIAKKAKGLVGLKTGGVVSPKKETGDPGPADTEFTGKVDDNGKTFTGKVAHRKDETPTEALTRAKVKNAKTKLPGFKAGGTSTALLNKGYEEQRKKGMYSRG